MNNTLKHIFNIVEADQKKNHKDKKVEELFNTIVHYLFNGFPAFIDDKVIITFDDLDGVLEFHCINGGSGKDLTSSLQKFLDKVDSYTEAVTFYDNPKVSQLAKYITYPSKVEQIDGGKDKTFKMSFDLRSK